MWGPAGRGAGPAGRGAAPAALGPRGRPAPAPTPRSLHLRSPTGRARSPPPRDAGAVTCDAACRLPSVGRNAAAVEPAGLAGGTSPGPAALAALPRGRSAAACSRLSRLAPRPPAPGAAPAAPDWPRRAPEPRPDWVAESRGGGMGGAQPGPAPGAPGAAASRPRCTSGPRQTRNRDPAPLRRVRPVVEARDGAESSTSSVGVAGSGDRLGVSPTPHTKAGRRGSLLFRPHSYVGF